MANLTVIRDGNNDSPVRALTGREEQVAALVCEGLSNKLIARTLNVSEGTIKAHLHATFTKLGIQSRSELIVRVSNLRVD
jgi:two-component system nitrate/nitrite response regulator NarL